MKKNTTNVKQANKIKAAVEKNTAQDDAIISHEKALFLHEEELKTHTDKIVVLETLVDNLGRRIIELENEEIKYPWKQELFVLSLYGIVGAGFVAAAILYK